MGGRSIAAGMEVGPARRRRWALGLRSLMGLVLVVGALLGGAARWEASRREAIATLRAAGWRVIYRDEMPKAEGWRVWLYREVGAGALREVYALTIQGWSRRARAEGAAAPARPESFRAIARVGRVDRVEVQGGGVAATELEAMADADVGDLGLMGVDAVPDDVLAAAGRIRSLRRLRVVPAKGRVSAAAPRIVGAMTNLESVCLSGCVPLSGADLLPLARLARLKELEVDPAPVDGAYLDRFLALDGIQTVWLRRTRITDAQLRRVAARWPGLTTLECDGRLLTDAAAGPLASLTRLQYLSLSGRAAGAPRLGDATLAAVGTLPALGGLEVTCGRFTDAGLLALRGLPLRELRLGEVESARPGTWSRLFGNRALPNLGLHGPGIVDAALPELAPAVMGQAELDLSRTAITDAGAAVLAAIPASSLNLSETALTDAGLATLNAGNLPNRELILWRTKVTPGGVAAYRTDPTKIQVFYGPAPPSGD